MEHIGLRIKRARLDAEMSPKDLAKALKLRSAEAVLAWERGKSQPRPSRYAATASATTAVAEATTPSLSIGYLPRIRSPASYPIRAQILFAMQI